MKPEKGTLKKLSQKFIRPRVIPALTLSGKGLVKTKKFSDPRYIGDPINSVKLFNDCEVDELMILDISQNLEQPKFDLISELCSEAFMPLCYGGGIRSYEHIEKLFSLGIEKVCLNTSAFNHSGLIERASAQYGAQSIMVCIDVKKNFWGKYEVMTNRGLSKTGLSPVEAAKKMSALGAGEIVLQSMDQDGVMSGYDLELIRKVTPSVSIPVIALGGAGGLEDFTKAVSAGAAAAAAGSLFVFHGKLKGILINYPTQEELRSLFQGALATMSERGETDQAVGIHWGDKQ